MQASNKVVPIPCVRRVFYEADENDDLQAQYRSAPVTALAYALHPHPLSGLAAAPPTAHGAPRLS